MGDDSDLRTLPMGDLKEVLEATEELWKKVAGASFFITGGTGFLGSWLLESLLFANDELGLSLSTTVLTRNSARFSRNLPHLAAHSAVTVLEGDVRSFMFPKSEFSHIVHAATEALSELREENRDFELFDIIVTGTKRVLDFSRQCGCTNLLLTSSGAVYGPQPHDLEHIPEGYSGGPSCVSPASAYGEGKRAAELLCCLEAAQRPLFAAKIARCFAFLGPRIPLERGLAAGNFIRDALRGGPIRIEGDGTPYRSYMYPSDLAAWLWTILFNGESCLPYNVGSEEPVTISELASRIGNFFNPPMKVLRVREPIAGQTTSRYIPSTELARRSLGLSETVKLSEAISRTVDWHHLPCSL